MSSLAPRHLFGLIAMVFLSACANTDPNGKLIPLGDFRMGYNFVLSTDVQKGPFSRNATEKELNAALSDAIEARLGRYDGNGLYHFGISIGGYVLAQPGLPVVYTPKSVMIFDVTVYDNATQKKLNEDPYRITAFEGLQNTAPIIGSGLARGKDAQLKNLATAGARQLQEWLARHPEWFVPDPETPRRPFYPSAEKSRLATAAAAKEARIAQPAAPTPLALGAQRPETAGAFTTAPASGGSVGPLALPAN